MRNNNINDVINSKKFKKHKTNFFHCHYVNWTMRGGYRKEDQMKFYAEMSSVAYALNPEKRKEKMVKFGLRKKGFVVINHLSNPDIAVIINPKTRELIFSITGSRFGDPEHRGRDIRSDIGIAFGVAQYGKRIKEVKQVILEGMKNYPGYEYTLTGHSLGGFIASKLSRDLGVPAIVFNRGSSPAGAISSKIANLFKKKKGEVIHYTTNKGTTIDPVSISAKLSGNDDKTITTGLTSDKHAHSLKHFGGGFSALKKHNKGGVRGRNAPHMNEKTAERIYRHLLKDKIYPLVGNKITYGSDLEKAGKKLFGNKFVGVYPSDKIPTLSPSKKYTILNLDKSNEGGSHWIGAVYDKGDIVCYDSYARKANKIIPSLKAPKGGRIINTDDDVEQKMKQTDCGARSLAWLLFFDRHGKKNAMLI